MFIWSLACMWWIEELFLPQETDRADIQFLLQHISKSAIRTTKRRFWLETINDSRRILSKNHERRSDKILPELSGETIGLSKNTRIFSLVHTTVWSKCSKMSSGDASYELLTLNWLWITNLQPMLGGASLNGCQYAHLKGSQGACAGYMERQHLNEMMGPIKQTIHCNNKQYLSPSWTKKRTINIVFL